MRDFFVEKESKQLDSCPVYAQLQSAGTRRQVIRPHIHSAIELLIVKSGSYRVYVGDRGYSAHPGDLVLLRSNTIHHTYSTDENGSSYYVIKVRPSLLAELSDGGDSGCLLFFALHREGLKCFWTARELDGTALGHAVSRFADEFENGGFAKSIAVTLAVSSILLGVLREGSPRQEPDTAPEGVTRRIYDTLLYINKNYNQPITALECSEAAGMSYSYFSRCFRAVVGKSFKEYLNITRINHAQKALMSTDMTVTETAAHCGFDNVSYFISVYKRLKGKTPHNERKG